MVHFTSRCGDGDDNDDDEPTAMLLSGPTLDAFARVPSTLLYYIVDGGWRVCVCLCVGERAHSVE